MRRVGVAFFKPLTARRTIVVGDVHGCIEELMELMRAVAYRPGDDRLVFVGDLVDRGPDPAAVVRYARSVGAECVMGNHDHKQVRWARHEAKRRDKPTYKNPMTSVSELEAEQYAQLRHEDRAWLASLPMILHLDDGWAVVHAGCEPRRRLERQNDNALLRLRYVNEAGAFVQAFTDRAAAELGAVPWASVWPGPESIVYGHMVHDLADVRIDEPAAGVSCYGIDTGACFGGRLTALLLPSREFVQVDAKRAYAELRYTDD